jgi:hypothetical protein
LLKIGCKDRRVAEGINDKKRAPYRTREEVNARHAEGVFLSGHKRGFPGLKKAMMIGHLRKF